MKSIEHIVWHRLVGLMPGELTLSELGWLLSPHSHLSLLSRRRAVMIVNRVRLIAFLFAVLTPLWSVIDYIVFPFPLWFALAFMRVVASAGFAALVILYKPDGSLANAWRAMAFLFAIPTIFYVASHTLLTSYELHGLSAAIGAGYAFLPFVLLAGFSIFPLTVAENVLFAAPVLLIQGISGILRWPTLDWPSFAGAFWLLTLIASVSALAGMSQLAFMIALFRQAIRDSLTGIFSRQSGEELLGLQFAASARTGTPLAIAFLDLDRFKAINDQHGHEAGDTVLVYAVFSITTRLRAGDVLARWGGEEFVLILPNTTREQALIALERLRRGGFGLRPEGTPVTASIGLAERAADGAADWRALVELADGRMYQAKQAGRDRIVHGEAPAPALR